MTLLLKTSTLAEVHIQRPLFHNCNTTGRQHTPHSVLSLRRVHISMCWVTERVNDVRTTRTQLVHRCRLLRVQSAGCVLTGSLAHFKKSPVTFPFTQETGDTLTAEQVWTGPSGNQLSLLVRNHGYQQLKPSDEQCSLVSSTVRTQQWTGAKMAPKSS